jgi:hypothetical protein
MTFSGRYAYIVELFRFEGCFVGHKVGKFIAMKNLLELENFRKHVLNLYNWRQHIIHVNYNVSIAQVNQMKKYDALTDVSGYIDICPVRSPRHKVEPVKVFLSPSRGSKRTRSFLNNKK